MSTSMCRVQRPGYGPDNPLVVRYGCDSDPSVTGYCNRGATCWDPKVKGLTAMVNGAVSGWRMETFVSTAEGKGSVAGKGQTWRPSPLEAAGPEQVLRYLSRYTHRVAISNRRLVAADNTSVAFRWKDYRINGPRRWKTMRLHPHEFIWRFLMHVLPKGFHRTRRHTNEFNDL